MLVSIQESATKPETRSGECVGKHIHRFFVGCERWTLRLLASQLVELGYVESVSHETVRQVLLTNELKPWIKKQWCIPTQADAEFVYHMEDVLEVYTRPYNPARPQVCMDEINTQLLADIRDPLPMEPGKPARQDCSAQPCLGDHHLALYRCGCVHQTQTSLPVNQGLTEH